MFKQIRSQSRKDLSADRLESGYPSGGDQAGPLRKYFLIGAGLVIVLTVLAFVLAVKILFFAAAAVLVLAAVGGAYIFLNKKLKHG